METRWRSESQRQTEGFGPSVTHGWATPAKMRRKKCCYGQKNLGQYSSMSPSPAHPSHTTTITLSRIKCERLYFYKEVYSFVHWSSYIMLDYVSAYICITAIHQMQTDSFRIWTLIAEPTFYIDNHFSPTTSISHLNWPKILKDVLKGLVHLWGVF